MIRVLLARKSMNCCLRSSQAARSTSLGKFWAISSGEGGTEKSSFVELATRFAGIENVCHLSLHRLETDRFTSARLR
jgi:phage/plasmid-associated DNA primase